VHASFLRSATAPGEQAGFPVVRALRYKGGGWEGRRQRVGLETFQLLTELELGVRLVVKWLLLLCVAFVVARCFLRRC
jgi:hypothetical protein